MVARTVRSFGKNARCGGDSRISSRCREAVTTRFLQKDVPPTKRPDVRGLEASVQGNLPYRELR